MVQELGPHPSCRHVPLSKPCDYTVLQPPKVGKTPNPRTGCEVLTSLLTKSPCGPIWERDTEHGGTREADVPSEHQEPRPRPQRDSHSGYSLPRQGWVASVPSACPSCSKQTLNTRLLSDGTINPSVSLTLLITPARGPVSQTLGRGLLSWVWVDALLRALAPGRKLSPRATCCYPTGARRQASSDAPWADPASTALLAISAHP